MHYQKSLYETDTHDLLKSFNLVVSGMVVLSLLIQTYDYFSLY